MVRLPRPWGEASAGACGAQAGRWVRNAKRARRRRTPGVCLGLFAAQPNLAEPHPVVDADDEAHKQGWNEKRRHQHWTTKYKHPCQRVEPGRVLVPVKPYVSYN